MVGDLSKARTVQSGQVMVRTFGLLRWIVLVFVFVYIGGSWAEVSAAYRHRYSHPVTENFCPHATALNRRGTESCWVSFPLPKAEDKNHSVCIPRYLWIQILFEARSDPRGLELCGKWTGKWLPTSYVSDEPHEAGHNPDEAKPVNLRFGVTAFVADPSRAPSLKNRLRVIIEYHRERLSERLRSIDRLGIFRRLLLNERVPDSEGDLLRQLGFVHLFTETGIYFYALAAMLMGGWRIGGRVVGRRLRVSVKNWRRVGLFFTLFAWLGMWVLSGLRPGAVRPLVVVVLRTVALEGGFRWRRYSPLLLAMTVDGLIGWIRVQGQYEPQIWDWAPGRGHYFLAVWGGLLGWEWAQGRRGRFAGLRSHSAMALGSWLPTALLDLWVEQRIAFATPLLSLLTIPLIANLCFPPLAILTLLDFTTSSGLWLFWYGLIESCNIAVEKMAELMMQLPLLFVVPWSTQGSGWLLYGIFLVSSLIALARPGRRVSYLVTVLLLGAVAWRVWGTGPPAESIGPVREVVQLDVGQGDAALILHENGADLIDTGSEKVRSRGRWQALLGRYGITELNSILLTHADEDHRGALERIRSIVPVRRVWEEGRTPGIISPGVTVIEAHAPLSKKRRRKKKKVGESAQSRRSNWGPISGPSSPPLLPPILAPSGGIDDRPNARMQGIWVEVKPRDRSRPWIYLNLGDATAAAEAKILPLLRERRLEYPAMDLVLKLSHHGSHTSSEEEWLRLLRPQEVWVSSGVGNRYGHPSPKVMSRVDALQIPVQRTDFSGALKKQTSTVHD